MKSDAISRKKGSDRNKSNNNNHIHTHSRLSRTPKTYTTKDWMCRLFRATTYIENVLFCSKLIELINFMYVHLYSWNGAGPQRNPFKIRIYLSQEREQEKEREQEGGEIVIDRNVKFSIEIGACAWFWFRFRFRGPVRPFDIVLMHTQNNQRKCEGELRIISMLLIGDWVTVLFFAAAFFFFRLLELSKTKTIKCLQPRWRRENKNMCIIRNWIFFRAKGKTNKWKK